MAATALAMGEHDRFPARPNTMAIEGQIFTRRSIGLHAPAVSRGNPAFAARSLQLPSATQTFSRASPEPWSSGSSV